MLPELGSLYPVSACFNNINRETTYLSSYILGLLLRNGVRDRDRRGVDEVALPLRYIQAHAMVGPGCHIEVTISGTNFSVVEIQRELMGAIFRRVSIDNAVTLDVVELLEFAANLYEMESARKREQRQLRFIAVAENQLTSFAEAQILW